MTLLAPAVSAWEPDFPMLREDLEDAHLALSKSINDLCALTRGPPPSRGAVVQARWSISSASLARRTLWHRILARLSVSRFADAQADVRYLQDADMALLQASCAHVTTWSIDAVMRDWATYCVASQQMRDKMTVAIEAEQRLLYPLLSGGE
jgi:hypothetical protein